MQPTSDIVDVSTIQTSTIRQHFRADGTTPKVAYRRKQAESVAAFRGPHMNTYRCQVCKQWHIGKGLPD